MTEASSTIRPPKVAYKETPYESPARIGNGAAPNRNDAIAASGGFEPPPQARLIRSIEETSPLARTSNNALIDAMAKIHAAVRQQIAYHEEELKKLRASLTPFASMSRQNDAPPEDAIRAVLDYADKMKIGDDTP
jgi:hypothetical protein